jgi:hypothetical protein
MRRKSEVYALHTGSAEQMKADACRTVPLPMMSLADYMDLRTPGRIVHNDIVKPCQSFRPPHYFDIKSAAAQFCVISFSLSQVQSSSLDRIIAS